LLNAHLDSQSHVCRPGSSVTWRPMVRTFCAAACEDAAHHRPLVFGSARIPGLACAAPRDLFRARGVRVSRECRIVRSSVEVRAAIDSCNRPHPAAVTHWRRPAIGRAARGFGWRQGCATAIAGPRSSAPSWRGSEDSPRPAPARRRCGSCITSPGVRSGRAVSLAGDHSSVRAKG